MTWTTFPTFTSTAVVAITPCRADPQVRQTRRVFRPGLQRSRAGYHFDDLARDRRLSNLVHVERQLLDHVRRVARGGIHRGHLRGVERGVGIEERLEHLHLDV